MRCGGGGLAVGPVVEDDGDDVAGEAEGHPHDERLQQEHARLVQRRHGHVSGAASLCPARAALSEVGAQVHADLARAPLPPSGTERLWGGMPLLQVLLKRRGVEPHFITA